MESKRQLGIGATLALLAAGFSVNANAQLAMAGDWVVRAGATWVMPNEDTTGASGPRVDDGTMTGSEVTIGNNVRPGLTIAYMLTDNVAVELLGAAPFRHVLHLDGGALDGARVGSIKHLPPTLSVQYHIATGMPFRPYVGAGLNYTLIFDEKVGRDAEAVGVRSISAKNSFGYGLQLGMDVPLGGGWLLNADLRYLDIDTTAKLEMDDGTTRVDIDINPLVVSLGVGRRF